MSQYRKYSDIQVVEGLKINDKYAYMALYYNRTKSLKSFVLHNGGDKDDIDEIEQKTIVILYEKIMNNSFELHSNTRLSTYLHSVGKNLWFQELRKRNRLISDDFIVDTFYFDNQMDLFVFEAQDEEEKLLLKALNSLNEICQKILKGKYYEKKSDKELSQEIATVSTENIRKRRYKCLQQLKRRFETLFI